MRITTLIIIYEANITLHLQFRSITFGFVAFLLLFFCSLIHLQQIATKKCMADAKEPIRLRKRKYSTYLLTELKAWVERRG